jgi:hypothetical protein
MAFVETELHKIHLRLEALEGKAAETHLQPSEKVSQLSSVKFPKPLKHEEVVEEVKAPKNVEPVNHKKESK